MNPTFEEEDKTNSNRKRKEKNNRSNKLSQRPWIRFMRPLKKNILNGRRMIMTKNAPIRPPFWIEQNSRWQQPPLRAFLPTLLLSTMTVEERSHENDRRHCLRSTL
mmetsp:Transcript_7505/g.11008  ORF Transcript_7505/g.11008 Transcript_7505/m.11008 type:complete len:106 (+) Transcript_7505:649-966(+)